MMVDFCWYLQREIKGLSYKKKPNALNISKAISHDILQKNYICLSQSSAYCEMVHGDYVGCIESQKTGTCGYFKNLT